MPRKRAPKAKTPKLAGSCRLSPLKTPKNPILTNLETFDPTACLSGVGVGYLDVVGYLVLQFEVLSKGCLLIRSEVDDGDPLLSTSLSPSLPPLL